MSIPQHCECPDCMDLRAENAKLKEQLRLTFIDMNNESSENDALRELVREGALLCSDLIADMNKHVPEPYKLVLDDDGWFDRVKELLDK